MDRQEGLNDDAEAGRGWDRPFYQDGADFLDLVLEEVRHDHHNNND